MIRRRIVLGVLFLVLFGLGWWAGRGRANGDLYDQLDVFVEILHKVEDNYVDPVDPHRLIEGAMKGMLADLDPYSRYLDPRAYDQIQTVTQGRFNGIGIEVAIRDHFPTIISPIEGSPAWEAGLEAGDAIVKIDGASTVDFTVEDTALKLRGAAGTPVRLTIARSGEEEPIEVQLARREIELKSVPYAFVAGDHVGYLRLASFSTNAGVEVREAVKRLHAAGARSLVLDLRRNPGGVLDQAIDVTEQFVPRGSLVVSTRGRSRGQNQRFLSSNATPETAWPMAVLIDEGSASASEIVAGALQDLDRALLLGRTSFGKASVQSVFPLPGRTAAVKLTTAHYYTPSGRWIHRGRPDSLALAAAEDEDEDEVAVPPEGRAAADTSRPVYRTAGGRVVYGGGGITPDAIVGADSVSPALRDLEGRSLPSRFAHRWVARHPGAAYEPAPAGLWPEFLAFAAAEKGSPPAAELAVERARVEPAILREIARRRDGAAAAARVALATDPVFREARARLERSARAADVFGPGWAGSGNARSPRPARVATGKDAPTAQRPAARRSRSDAP